MAASSLRVLVTGSAGLLGRHVVAALAAAGHAVHGVDRVVRAGAPGEHTVADLATWDGLGAAVRAADAVVHLAAIPNLDTDPEAVVYDTNVSLTRRIAFAAIESGVRSLVYASSQTVLGQALAPRIVPPERLPVDESHPLVPREGYGLSKLAGEGLAQLVGERLGIPALALRLPVIWAPETFDRHVAKRTGDPAQAAKSLWAYVDARDAGEGFRLAVEHATPGFAALQLGADQPFAGEDIRTLAERWYPGVPRDVLTGPHEPVFSIARARALLGYAPRFRWSADGVADTARTHEVA